MAYPVLRRLDRARGKRADLVLWDPAFFGVKPELILLGGSIVAALMEYPNASISDTAAGPLPPDVRRVRSCNDQFRRDLCVEGAIGREFGTSKAVLAVENTRGGISKASMIRNSATPHIEVDPETYEVRADGVLLTCEPAKVLPMAQRYFLTDAGDPRHAEGQLVEGAARHRDPRSRNKKSPAARHDQRSRNILSARPAGSGPAP